MVAEPSALLIALQAAVPLHIAELRGYDESLRYQMIHAIVPNRCGLKLAGEPCPCDTLSDVIAYHGDVLQYGGRGCARAFNALARSLALLALRAGGVTFAGHHWCQSGHMGSPQPEGCTSGPCSAEVLREQAVPGGQR